MDPMVSSRVPASLHDRVNTRLKEIGSNPTELIKIPVKTPHEFLQFAGKELYITYESANCLGSDV